MPQTIEQKVKFNAPPEELFEIYINPQKHSVACGHKTYVSRKVGANFSVPPYLSGKNLAIVPKKMIVQAWREHDWEKNRFGFHPDFKFQQSQGVGGRFT